MKIRSLIAIAASGLMLAACQGNGADGKSADALKNASPADSLMYYFGQMRGAEYHRQAERDTTLNTSKSKNAYMQGVQAGMSAVKGGDEAYNQGLFLGMQMAMNFQQFKKDYDVTLNKRVFLEGLSNVLQSDSIPEMQDAQREFYRIMGDFNSAKEAREKEAAAAALSKEAANMKLTKISDDVYGTVTSKTDSLQIKDGDSVEMDVKLAKVDGKEIEVPLPKKGKVGARNFLAPLNDMLKSLKSGETGKFVTPAVALFGQRVSQLGLEPADVVVVTLKASALPADSKGEGAGKPALSSVR